MEVKQVGLIEGDEFGAEQCLSLFRRLRLGHLSVSVRGLPVVVPVPYAVDDCGFLIGISEQDIASAMNRNVVALQSDAWDDDVERRWTVLAVGIPVPATVEQEPPPCGDKIVPNPWQAPHVFRLQAQALSGRWID